VRYALYEELFGCGAFLDYLWRCISTLHEEEGKKDVIDVAVEKVMISLQVIKTHNAHLY
jgi:hypothetical protein